MVSYSVVLLLPLIISMIGYQVAFGIVEDNLKETNLSMIVHSKNMIDNQIDSINTLMMQIASSQTLESMSEVKSTEDKAFYYESSRVIDGIAAIERHSNIELLDKLYIYLGNTDYVLTPQAMYKADFYYQYILKQPESSSELRKKLFLGNFYHNTYVIQDEKIQFLQSIPVKFNTPASGVIIASINKDKLLAFFEAVDLNEGCYLYIQDKEGNLVMNLPSLENQDEIMYLNNFNQDQEIVEQADSIVLRTTSDINDWVYTLILPEKIVMKELLQFKQLITVLFICAVVIGVFISYYLAKKNGEPIHELIKKIKHSMLEADIYQESNDILEIGETISKIVSSNQILKEEIEKQQPLLQTAFFQNLIKGEFNNLNEIHLVAERANIKMNAKQHVVLTYKVFPNNDAFNIDTQTLQEVSVASIFIKQILEETISNTTYFYGIDYLTKVAIIEVDQAYNSQDVLKALDRVNQRISKAYNIMPAWGISLECKDLLEIWRAYEQAKKALFTAVSEESRSIVSYSEVLEDKSQYYYSLAFEQKLMTYTQTADIENIKHLLEVLYVENFESRNLASEMIKKLYNEINSTLIKLTGDNIDETSIEQLRGYMDKTDEKNVSLYFAKLVQIYTEISNGYKQTKVQSQTKLSNKIIEYIQEVYMDANLGLGMIATKFNISEGYVSSLFKEQTGINFTEYVEKLRIGKACEKLVQTNISINEIGEQVGYNSVQSFRRAFKRMQGISPSEYRKQHE